ncbi:MAG: peptide ABC transporter substrate-binding protein [Dehalococcoidia bacterium]
MPSVRRGPLTLLLVAGLVLLAAGWVRAATPGQPGDARYVEAVVGVPSRVNPHVEPANEAEADLAALVFGGLMRLRADGAPEPELAQRWEVTPDGLTYTFHLRPGVSWQDGAAFDAGDVAFTIARIQSESFEGSAALRAEWAGVQVFVADSLTVLIRLPEPAADFLVRATVGLLPEHLADRMARSGSFETPPFDRDPVGTGPYRLIALEDGRAVLEHNTSYVLGTPDIARIELRFAEDATEQAQMLRDGAVDAALLPAAGSETTIEALREDGAAVDLLHGDSYTVLYLNNSRSPLTEAVLRRAILASIDPAAALQAAGSNALAGGGVVVPGSWAHPAIEDGAAGTGGTDGTDGTDSDADTPGAPPDLDALWDATGWERGPGGLRQRGGQPLTLELVTNGQEDRVALAQALADQLGAQGVTVQVIAQPAQRVISDYLRTASYDLALFGWEAGADPDPYTGWHTSQIGAGNVAAFSDQEADALLEAARTTLDVAERRDLYAQFLDRFEELGASRVVAYPQRAYVHPEGLRGFVTRILSSPSSRFQDVHLWRLD